MDWFPVVVVLAFAIAGAVFGYLRWRHEQKRREAIARLCLERGWSFAPRRDELARQLRGSFPLFRQGNARRECRNVVTVTGAVPCTLFDYSYVTRRGGGPRGAASSSTTRVAVAIARLPVWLPSTRLAPESALTRLAGTVGFRDIELESVEFNRRFRVQADDRAHAFAVLHPLMMEHLLSQPADTWEVAGSHLLVSHPGRWDVAEYDDVVAAVRGFVELVPDHVWREHGASP
jgi:hypothetical protein